MAFFKFAAQVSKASISLRGWADVRKKAGKSPNIDVSPRLLRLGEFQPDKFLLTHVTIISSVDVEKNGYYITPRTTKFINANADAWERKLLLATYPTFVGGENYLEHVQVPSLSKGKILDAVARDLGDSIYIDILVATNRKHRDLVAKIEKNELSTLSMGCNVAFTICSRCGNKAYDETQLCPHIMYGKGDLFIDEEGVERKIAELCGHFDDPDSVAFIEASWVNAPAFEGAVKRNVIPTLTSQQLATAMERRGATVVAMQSSLKRVASIVKQAGVSAEKQAEVDAAIQEASKQADMSEEDFPSLKQKKKRKEEPMPSVDGPRRPEELDPNQNDNLIQSNQHTFLKKARSQFSPQVKISEGTLLRYNKMIFTARSSGWESLKGSIDQRQFLTAMVLDSAVNQGHKGLTARLAKMLVVTGPRALYSTDTTFLERCAELIDRPLVKAEQQVLLTTANLMGNFPESKEAAVV